MLNNVTFLGMAESDTSIILKEASMDITGNEAGSGASNEDAEGAHGAQRSPDVDESMLDESDGEEHSAIAKESAKKSSESVSALVNTFTKVRVGSEDVFHPAGQSTSTGEIRSSSIRAPEPPKQEGGGSAA